MNHKEFCEKWIGKGYAETPELGIQCVGGAKKYAQERGWKIGAFGGSAIQGWKTGIPFNKDWIRVEYKPGLFPPQGALIFWSEKRVKYGHVAIGNKYCNKDVLRCIDQNGTSNSDPFTHRFYDYKHVLGWYVHK